MSLVFLWGGWSVVILESNTSSLICFTGWHFFREHKEGVGPFSKNPRSNSDLILKLVSDLESNSKMYQDFHWTFVWQLGQI